MSTREGPPSYLEVVPEALADERLDRLIALITGCSRAEAVDAIRSRFGSALIKPARLVGSDRRPGDQQWGPSDPSAEGEGTDAGR